MSVPFNVLEVLRVSVEGVLPSELAQLCLEAIAEQIHDCADQNTPCAAESVAHQKDFVTGRPSLPLSTS